MAELKSPTIGSPSGRIENAVYRIRNGKVIAYARPLNQKVSKSQKAVTARRNFAAVVKFARSVNMVPNLKEIWKSAKVPGINSNQKLIRNNAKLVRDGFLTASNIITPKGLPLNLNSAAIENKVLHLSFYFQGSPDFSFPARLYIYLYFGKASGAIIPLFRELTEPSPDGIYNQEIVFDSYTKRFLSKDSAPLIFLALEGGTAYKKKVYWTTTASTQL